MRDIHKRRNKVIGSVVTFLRYDPPDYTPAQGTVTRIVQGGYLIRQFGMGHSDVYRSYNELINP